MWDSLRTALSDSAIETFGTGTYFKYDWTEAKHHILAPLIERKRNACLAHTTHPSQSTLKQQRNAKSEQKELRKCAN